jgi:cyanophycinase
LWAMYRRGGVIGGTSAGAAIMSSTMFYEGQAPLPTLKNGITDGRDIAPGLGFIGDEVFVDQHLLVRGRFARMLPAMLAKRYKIGLGIDENTAAVVTRKQDTVIQIIGYKGAILLDLGQASSDTSRPGFNLANARISYMDSGDRYEVGNKTFTPGDDKEKIDAPEAAPRGSIFAPDILGNTAVVDLLWKLGSSGQAGATGIAFGNPAGGAPERGFEFSFTRTPETEAFESNRADTYSVYRVRLDVKPIRIAQPLYRAE